MASALGDALSKHNIVIDPVATLADAREAGRLSFEVSHLNPGVAIHTIRGVGYLLKSAE